MFPFCGVRYSTVAAYILHDSMEFRLHLIETITNNFAEEKKIGSAAYGAVYKVYYNTFWIKEHLILCVT